MEIERVPPRRSSKICAGGRQVEQPDLVSGMHTGDMSVTKAKDFDLASPSIPKSQIDVVDTVRVDPIYRSPNIKRQRPAQIAGPEGRRVSEIPYTPVSHVAPSTIRAYLGEAGAGSSPKTDRYSVAYQSPYDFEMNLFTRRNEFIALRKALEYRCFA